MCSYDPWTVKEPLALKWSHKPSFPCYLSTDPGCVAYGSDVSSGQLCLGRRAGRQREGRLLGPGRLLIVGGQLDLLDLVDLLLGLLMLELLLLLLDRQARTVVLSLCTVSRFGIWRAQPPFTRN